MAIKQGWTGRCYEDFESGIVQVKTSGFNQHGKVVIEFKRTIMVYKRAYLPKLPQPEIQPL